MCVCVGGGIFFVSGKKLDTKKFCGRKVSWIASMILRHRPGFGAVDKNSSKLLRIRSPKITIHLDAWQEIWVGVNMKEPALTYLENPKNFPIWQSPILKKILERFLEHQNIILMFPNTYLSSPSPPSPPTC